MTLATDHMEVSRRLIGQADAEFDKRDLLQASEKAWGSVAHALKGIAQLRRWRRRSHRELFSVATRIGEETGQPEFRRLFQVAESLHANFYENWMPVTAVRDSIDDVRGLLDSLERLPTAGPTA